MSEYHPKFNHEVYSYLQKNVVTRADVLRKLREQTLK